MKGYNTIRKGYVGLYKENLLKSSYEYAYAKYLDFHNINWKYEEHTYEIDDLRYTPDFFIYNEQGKLKKIVEIRGGRVKEDIDFAKFLLAQIENELNINTELVLLRDLYTIYEDMPFTINKITNEWIESEETVLNRGYNGQNNPNFGNKHSIKTKNIIGLKSKERWQNPEYRQRMMDILHENAYKISMKLKGVEKAQRETRNCLNCNNPFVVTVNSKKRYCSQECAALINITKATEQYVNNRNEIHNEIKQFILEWAKENKEKVINTPYNKISTTLNDLVNKINENYGVIDFRSISKSVFGVDKGRKELLKYMKENI